VAYGIYLAGRKLSSRGNKVSIVFTRSAQNWLISSVLAFSLVAISQAQEGKPRAETRPALETRQTGEKCCGDAKQKGKTNGGEGTHSLSPVERFGARTQMILGSGQPAKGEWGIMIDDANTGQELFEQNADR
jgi:hypothetical protein